MTSTNEQPPTITAADISLIRRADDLLIHHADGRNYIGAIKRGRHDDPFDSDKRVEIPIQGNGGDGNFSYHPALEGLAHGVMRVGDIVSVDWMAGGGTNDHLRDAGLVCDLLYLHVRRGKRSFRFLIDTQVCPPDSPSRMCRASANANRYSLA